MKLFGINLPDWARARLTDAQRFLLLCIIAGLLCGLAAVGFHLSIHGCFDLVWHIAQWLERHGALWAVPLLPSVGGYLSGYLLKRYATHARGSGIPQTKAAFYNKFGVISVREGLWRFVVGTLYVGSGNALGREGPTVHMCAAIASGLGQSFGLAKARIQGMVPVGMGAGIAAAFNAPLSAILFVFEELLDDFSTKALAGIVAAVVIAATVYRMILGEDPVLQVNLGRDVATAPWMLVCVPMGIAAALLGHGFVRGLLATRRWAKAVTALPAGLLPGLGGLACGLVGTLAYVWTGAFGQPEHGVFSIGYESLGAAFDAGLVWQAMAILLVGKVIAVLICYATGGSGGLFSPTLFIGGMLGGLFGIGLAGVDTLLPIFRDTTTAHIMGASVLLGMGALFAAVIRCPFTSLVIIFEMTRDYSLILPLMIGNMIAYYLAGRLQPVPLYNALLLQDGINLRRMPAYQGARDYRNLPVSTIMTYDVVAVDAEMTSTEALADLEKRERYHHGYPVADTHGRLCGMVMHHELASNVEHGVDVTLRALTAGQKLITVTPETSIREAAAVMIRTDVQQVPVVARSDPRKLLGLLTLHDITRQQNTVTEQVGR